MNKSLSWTSSIRKGFGIGIFVLLGAISAQAQTPDQNQTNKLGARFFPMNKEAGFECGVLLPSNMLGITELMPICGIRFDFKAGAESMWEAQFVGGNAKGQGYYMGSMVYRADFPLDEVVASFYAGLDVTDAISPIRDLTGIAYDNTSTWYLGLVVGTALLFPVSDIFYLRTDVELNISPGTALLFTASAVYRFDGGGGAGQ